MEEGAVPYIEIRFSYSSSYIYQECMGLGKRMQNFVPCEKNTLNCNTLTYTLEQVKQYDIYFDFFITKVFRLSNTKVYFQGIEVDRALLNNLRWRHQQKRHQPYGYPIGMYEEFFKKKIRTDDE